jgi:glycosyltransferase involved in cell wall biosynthesis
VTLALAWIDLDDPTDRAVALGLAAELRAAGRRVVIVGPRRGAQPAREDVGGIAVRRVGHPALERLGVLNDAWAFAQLLLLQRSERLALWHCHLFARRHRALRWAATLGGRPLVASLHLVLPDYLAAAGGKRELGSLLRRAARVTAVSAASLEQVRRLFPEIAPRSSLVANGVAAPRPDPEPREPLPDGPYALCASRLAPYKGLDLLLMALAELGERGRGLRLVLCGRDQMKGGLQGFARRLGLEDRVVFAGAVPPARLNQLMAGCLFFALPSRRENQPLALLEAMAAGKPVVAARVGGVPEIVTDGVDGLLVEPGDVGGLARAMAALVEDAGLRERLGQRARARGKDFGWAGPAAQYRALYPAP